MPGSFVPRLPMLSALMCLNCGTIGIDVPDDLDMQDLKSHLGGAGNPSTGGRTASGGTPNTGGKPASGDGTGGQVASGGAFSGSGGVGGSGGEGDSGSGGLLGIGGIPGTGGIAGLGGAQALEELYQEDLESGELPSGPDGVNSNHAQLSTDIVYRGTYALRSQQMGSSLGRADLVGHFSPRPAGTSIHTRVWVYIPEDSLNGRLDIFQLSAEGESLDFGVNYEGRLSVFFSTQGSLSSSAAGSLSHDDWICIETHTVIDDVAGSVQVSLDEEPVLFVSPRDTSPIDGFSSFSFGLLAAHDNQTNGKIYFDDVVVSTAPIGCD